MSDASEVKELSINGIGIDSKGGSYPLSRSFYLAYSGRLTDLEQDFLTYIHSAGQEIVGKSSIAQTYLIIDEAQNMIPNQVKGIITRAGKDTKIILLGDPNQIDKPFLHECTNGLSYAAKYMKGSPLCWQITLSAEECERSVLAMDAVKRL